MIANFGKAFWYAPGVMMTAAVIVSVFSLEGPTALTVDAITGLINTFGTDAGKELLSQFVSLYAITVVTIGLALTAADIIVGLQLKSTKDHRLVAREGISSTEKED